MTQRDDMRGRRERDQRRVLMTATVVSLAAAASGALLFLRPEAPGVPGAQQRTAPIFAQAGGPPPGDPGMPGGPGAPGGAPGGGGGGPQGAPTKPKPPTSFDNVPPSLGGTGGGAAAGGVDPAMGGVPGAGMPGAAPAGPTGPKPDPIVEGRRASDARTDPFISRFIFPPQRPPAYAFALPLRLAPPFVPKAPERKDIDPELRLGPLPYVQRRVAGVLYNGGISAILETGTPGTSSVVEIVTPGAQVVSGIPGIPYMIVDSITVEEMVLRAPDGRTSTVKLSNLPAGVADALRGQAGGGFGAPGGPPGFPGGGPGFPGGPPPGDFGGGAAPPGA